MCVVIAAKGYPETYPKGDVITLPVPAALPPATVIFHAGTARNAAGELVTHGGRVLGVTALGGTLREAADRADIQRRYETVLTVESRLTASGRNA